VFSVYIQIYNMPIIWLNIHEYILYSCIHTNESEYTLGSNGDLLSFGCNALYSCTPLTKYIAGNYIAHKYDKMRNIYVESYIIYIYPFIHLIQRD